MTGYSKITLNRARTLRHVLTDAEVKLWHRLRNRQLANAKFRRQAPIGPYIADFFCADAKLIVEVDGSQHAESAHDTKRDAFLQAQGYHVLRFWNGEIFDNLDGVLETLYLALTTKNPHPNPSPSRGEGLDAERYTA